jgi:diguanylate cyclase (GGDEF)-like protein
MEAFMWAADAHACIARVGENLVSLLLPSLFVFNTLVYALLCLFMFFMWREDKAEEFRFWSLAYFLNCAALLLFASSDAAASPWTAAAGALTLLALGALWTGVRVFAERPIRKAAAMAGGLMWITVFSHAAPLVRLEGRAALVAIYSFLIAYELYSYNKERLTILPATAALAAFHGGFNALLVISAPFVTMDNPTKSTFDIPIVKFMVVEAMIYGIVLGFALLALSKTRAAARQKIAALTDPLTGLPNRRAFDLAAERAMKLSNGAKTPVLLLFDLDRFKAINDRFGHAEGDRALRTFAEVAANNISAGDILARVGGEEFAALLMTDPSTALLTAERIRCAFAKEAAPLADGVVSVSVGVAAPPDDGTLSLAKLMRAADEALYMAKAAGRNRVFLSPDIAVAGPRATKDRFDEVFAPLNAA